MGPIDHSPIRGLWHEVSIPHLPTYNPRLNFMLGITMEETLFGIFLGMLIEGCETTGFHFNEFDRISRFNVWIWNLIESHLQSVNVDIQCIYLHALLIYRYIYIYIHIYRKSTIPFTLRWVDPALPQARCCFAAASTTWRPKMARSFKLLF